jgi:hypothetical protein
MMDPRICIASLSLLALSGCATITADVPGSRLESPEALGLRGRRFEGSLAAIQGHTLEITSDASMRPPTLTNPKLEKGGAFGATGNFGALKKLDIGLKSALGPSPWLLTAKLQLLGDNANDAKEGNTSLAVTAGAGLSSSTREGDQKGEFGPGGYPWNAKVQSTASDFAIIAGYRALERLLIYGGGFFTRHWINCAIDHSASDNGLSPAAHYEVAYSTEQLGANLGLRVEFGASPGFLVAEAGYSDLQLSNGMKDWQILTSFALGARF